jgi:hypothetical protein
MGLLSAVQNTRSSSRFSAPCQHGTSFKCSSSCFARYSSFHLQIVREGQQFILIHPHPGRQQTANGLLYQGRKILGDESYRKVLVGGDVFRIGDEQGTLITLSYQDGSGIQQEALPPMRPSSSMPPN